ncbi:hypothetical protein D3C79_986270 [compost metagenome]
MATDLTTWLPPTDTKTDPIHAQQADRAAARLPLDPALFFQHPVLVCPHPAARSHQAVAAPQGLANPLQRPAGRLRQLLDRFQQPDPENHHQNPFRGGRSGQRAPE